MYIQVQIPYFTECLDVDREGVHDDDLSRLGSDQPSTPILHKFLGSNPTCAHMRNGNMSILAD